ncbi:MBL fold metallo-hydrolase [Methyloprofundus sedimenti]|uniref:MBL fold metallo-hydrolase n=1 Tax=Methyloprofundus sedimenti TaxID=1420851 RepID=A0A1V8MA82_9GAMM|nr:MBL fold metallo-hydrolase [Methyloprofundus sedimenti]OQK18213.1 MBL fold metallo-hydrolase [Methyloprofundus sedimenti]
MSTSDSLANSSQQWVCLQCGYNMIGEMPDICPFCGARHDQFLPWGEVELRYCVTTHPVNNTVSQLLSVPKLGLEHAAYRIETEQGAVWIDSPSAFNRELAPVKAIFFTHHHFLGACNQYRRLWHAEVWLHDLDAKHRLSALFNIDRRFSDDFSVFGLNAYHTGGHTPGFTFYIYQDVLFICDYVFLVDTDMHFNPHGPNQATRECAQRIYDIIIGKPLNTVCGYNYVANFTDWLIKFEHLLHNEP